MRNLKFLIYGLLCLHVFSFTACGSDDDSEQLDIVGTASANDDLSSLVEALTQAGLVSTLQGTGPFTVFAPTNAAFQELLDSNPAWNTLSDIPNDVLTSVLTFHVLAADVKAADLTDSYVTTLSEGPNEEQIVLQIDVTGGVKFNNAATPITTDVATTNGTVHIIDKVMLPPSVVNLALNNPELSSLVAALTRSDLTTDYVSILSGSGPLDGPFTVFAPTNAAFDALLASNPAWNTLNDIPVATLEAVLNYHVVNGANVQSRQLTNNQTVTTLGGTLTVDLTAGAKLKTTSNQTVNIVLTDAQGTNGVVHVVDAVLIP
jgi:transforming growth factor-beta-induced protein